VAHCSDKVYFTSLLSSIVYDQEQTYWRGSCIHEDRDQMIDSMISSAIGLKDFTIIDVARVCPSFSMQPKVIEEKEPPTIDELLVSTAYGCAGLGMPITGKNAAITERSFQDFQKTFITPKNLLISAANVESHADFVQAISSKLKQYPECKPTTR